MYLEIVTPDKKVFEGDVKGVQLPGVDGSFEILENHAAFISALGNGKLRLTTVEGKRTMNIEGGTVEVANNKVTVLAETITE